MKTKKTKSEIIEFIKDQEKEHWESLQQYTRDLGHDDYRVYAERARWYAFQAMLDFMFS